jgi:hypothetical protein
LLPLRLFRDGRRTACVRTAKAPSAAAGRPFAQRDSIQRDQDPTGSRALPAAVKFVENRGSESIADPPSSEHRKPAQCSESLLKECPGIGSGFPCGRSDVDSATGPRRELFATPAASRGERRGCVPSASREQVRFRAAPASKQERLRSGELLALRITPKSCNFASIGCSSLQFPGELAGYIGVRFGGKLHHHVIRKIVL